MTTVNAPDLGSPFTPSGWLLHKLARDKSRIILSTLKKNNFILMLPEEGLLVNFLSKRMREQGRFVPLKVRRQNSIFFMKFPLGGKSARNIAKREHRLYLFVNALEHEEIVPRQVELIKTPFGYGLTTPYYDGTRLQHEKKTDKIEQISNLIYNLQTLLENRNFSAELVKDPLLYNTLTHPIHSFQKYQKEIESRAKVLPSDLSNRILTFVSGMRKSIDKFQGTPVFAHRDFFDKNIIVIKRMEVGNLKLDYEDRRWNKNTSNLQSQKSNIQPLTSSLNTLVLVDFEHAAIVKNYILGLNFDLANIIVQWYRYPRITNKLISLVRKKHINKKVFDVSLKVCLIIQILAKIDPVAQLMHPGGVEENLKLLKSLLA